MTNKKERARKRSTRRELFLSAGKISGGFMAGKKSKTNNECRVREGLSYG